MTSSFFSKFKRRLSLKAPTVAKVLTKFDDNAVQYTSTGQPVVPLFRPASHHSLARSVSTQGDEDSPAATKERAAVSRNGYSWQVKEWKREDLEYAQGLNAIRFEWKKGPSKARSTRSTATRPNSMISRTSLLPRNDSVTNLAGIRSSSRASSIASGTGGGAEVALEAAATATKNQHLLPQIHRPQSFVSPSDAGDRSRSPSMWENGALSSESQDGDEQRIDNDDGDESDFEDSERPWICHLVIDSSASIPSAARGGGGAAIVRIYVATLAPAPHHPKLVASLAMPFSLTPISLGGNAGDGMSVEEIKDVVAVSALWLIVRERLGGSTIAKVKKRG